MRRAVLTAGVVFSCVIGFGWTAVAADDKSAFEESTFTGLAFRNIGPAFMSGRIADIAIHPHDESTWYVAVGSGGVWKTTNAGTTWTPIFDDQGSYSIGCITIDPSRPETVWVGTGENVGGRHVGYGDGVYRSRDGGQTWENMGLKESEHIGSIRIDPRDSNVVYVAAQGPLWSEGGERGLFKSEDGGTTWTKLLGGGPYTGVNEVVMDPENPDVLYASTHQRLRTVAALINGGPESRILKSTDSGANWRELTNGLPEVDKGKIGLAVSPQDPSVIYATVELAHREGGFYRSTDGGEKWEKRNDFISGATGPHYYQELFASPHQFDRVYQMDTRMRVTNDGGTTMTPVNTEQKHVDDHAMAFTSDPNYLLVGCDGGLYESFDLGESWRYFANLPVTQFYKVAVDYDEPFYHVMGGTQDNNTQYGPSRTDNANGIRNSDWIVTLFGDGHQPAIDPTNPEIIYSEWQQGNLTRFDRVTGEMTYIQPQPEKGEPTERFNWDSPILISPHDPARLYFASQRVWRSDDRGDSWRAVSGDVTRGEDRFTLPMMGRVWSYDAIWDLYAMSKFATVTSLSESPLVEGLLYAGTDDGIIQISEDSGQSWKRIDKLPGVPQRFFVNDIRADLHDPDTVYVVVDDHKSGDFSPYVLRSTNRGRSWKSMVGNLPDRHVAWRIVQDHVKSDLLFLATEFGVFFTVDAGERWTKLKGGAPNIPFRDIVIQRRENDLVGATFGRGFFILDDYSSLREVDDEVLATDLKLFAVKDAKWYVERTPMGGDGQAWQGDSFYVAENPPFGATFTYYLGSTIKTRKQVRQEREKKLAEEGDDTPYPGWSVLQDEELEAEPQIILTVRNTNGEVVRRLSGPATKGFHRVAWDLRYPETSAWQESEGDEFFEPRGPLAAPGRYSVEIGRMVDGQLDDAGQSFSFLVEPLRERGMIGASPGEVATFMQDYSEFARQTDGANARLTEVRRRVEAIREVLIRSTLHDPAIESQVAGLNAKLVSLDRGLNGDQRRGFANDQGPMSISDRLGVVFLGNFRSTYGPTSTHLRSLEIAREQFAEFRRELSAIASIELPELESALEAAGVPWTPGRAIPGGR